MATAAKSSAFQKEVSSSVSNGNLYSRYTVDFYCVEAKLVVEVDGDSHLSEKAAQYDAARDRWMQNQGIRVLRFTCTQVDKNTQQVLATIDNALKKQNPLTPQPPLPMNSGDD